MRKEIEYDKEVTYKCKTGMYVKRTREINGKEFEVTLFKVETVKGTQYYDVCNMCGMPTNDLFTTPVEMRFEYIEGAGPVCLTCIK